MPLLLVDGGNALFSSNVTSEPLDQDILKARGISEIFTRLGYHAMGVGPLDLRDGGGLVAQTNAKGTPWVSANLLDRDGQPLVPPWRKVTTAGLSIGIIGLTGQVVSSTDSTDYTIGAFRPLLDKYVRELHQQFEMLILLSSLSPEENGEIASSYPEVSLIITADARAGNVPPRQINQSLLMQTHSQGKYLGILDARWSRENGWNGTDGEESSRTGFGFRFRSLANHIREAKDIAADVERIKVEIRQLGKAKTD